MDFATQTESKCRKIHVSIESHRRRNQKYHKMYSDLMCIWMEFHLNGKPLAARVWLHVKRVGATGYAAAYPALHANASWHASYTVGIPDVNKQTRYISQWELESVRELLLERFSWWEFDWWHSPDTFRQITGRSEHFSGAATVDHKPGLSARSVRSTQHHRHRIRIDPLIDD